MVESQLQNNNTPPADIMGVENSIVNWHVDYLTVTVSGGAIDKIWDVFLHNYFGELVDLGYGGRFYSCTYRAALGVTVRSFPVSTSDYFDDQGNYVSYTTLELPGAACQIMGYTGLSDLFQALCRFYDTVHVTRLDLAWDNVSFTPKQVYEAASSGCYRSYAKRDQLAYYEYPYKIAENGRVGLSSCTIGSRSSERYMRVYDKHGYTRLELELKDRRSDIVAVDLFTSGEYEACKLAFGHLRDYIDFLVLPSDTIRELQNNRNVDYSSYIVDWWADLVCNIQRLYATVKGTAKNITVNKMLKWMLHQIAPAYSTLLEVTGYDLSYYLDAAGRQRRYKNKGYSNLLSLSRI